MQFWLAHLTTKVVFIIIPSVTFCYLYIKYSIFSVTLSGNLICFSNLKAYEVIFSQTFYHYLLMQNTNVTFVTYPYVWGEMSTYRVNIDKSFCN